MLRTCYRQDLQVGYDWGNMSILVSEHCESSWVWVQWDCPKIHSCIIFYLDMYFFWRLLRIKHTPPQKKWRDSVGRRRNHSWATLSSLGRVCVCGPGLGSKAKICALELVRCLGIIWNLGLAFLDCFARKIKQSPNVDVVIFKHRVANFLNITAQKKNKIHCPRFCSSLTCRVHKEKAFCVVLYCSGYWDHLFVSLSWAIVPKPSLFYFTAKSLRKHCFGFRLF